jgi:hypothetical protein
VRQHVLVMMVGLIGCSGDWMTGPGTPLELSHESLRGERVEVLVVTTTSTAVYRTEYSTDEGEIVEFDGAGGVQHSRYGWDVAYTSPTYTISGDTLTMELAYQAEVSTTQLLLTLRGISGDYDGDGDQEGAIQVQTFQRGKD